MIWVFFFIILTIWDRFWTVLDPRTLTQLGSIKPNKNHRKKNVSIILTKFNIRNLFLEPNFKMIWVFFKIILTIWDRLRPYEPTTLTLTLTLRMFSSIYYTIIICRHRRSNFLDSRRFILLVFSSSLVERRFGDGGRVGGDNAGSKHLTQGAGRI